jgi:S1-C subfamily serine protease
VAADGLLQTTLTRGEVRVALADFARLTTTIRGELTPAGAKIGSVADGSVFAKAGLRAGDVVTSVDGKPMHTIDDAADLYVRASTARNITVQLMRAGKPATLKLSIQ